jgi:hypothetical protein
MESHGISANFWINSGNSVKVVIKKNLNFEKLKQKKLKIQKKIQKK